MKNEKKNRTAKNLIKRNEENHPGEYETVGTYKTVEKREDESIQRRGATAHGRREKAIGDNERVAKESE